MHAEPARFGRTWALRLDPGEDLLEGLQRAADGLGVRDGAFLGGVGSLTSYRVHVVSSTDLPPENAFMQGDGPFDILAVTGHVLGGRVHAHPTFSGAERAMGGTWSRGAGCRRSRSWPWPSCSILTWPGGTALGRSPTSADGRRTATRVLAGRPTHDHGGQPERGWIRHDGARRGGAPERRATGVLPAERAYRRCLQRVVQQARSR